MSLNRKEVNALSALGLRRLTFIPEHFTKLTISALVDTNILSHWIEYNLNSRYSIVKRLSLDESNNFVEVTEIGFEDPKEMLMLTLGCSILNKN